MLVCDLAGLKTRVAKGAECLVYALGSRGNFDFERAVRAEISESCEVHTFDEKPYQAYRRQQPPSWLSYHEAAEVTESLLRGLGLAGSPLRRNGR